MYFHVGNFNIRDIRNTPMPRLDNTRIIDYHMKYGHVPEIAVGLTSLDIDHHTNIRIQAFADEVTIRNFKVCLQSWHDTTLYDASMTWLEKNSCFGDTLQIGIYTTRELSLWHSPKPRQTRINFTTPFQSTPNVVTWLNSLDMDKRKNFRIGVYPSEIDRNGFTIHAETWADSILYSAGVTWLAFPSNQPGVTCGTFSTDDIRSSSNLQANNSGMYKFSTKFNKTPNIIVAFDYLDYTCDRNLRARVSTSEITKTGFKWHLESWADSVMHGSGASFIAWI